MMSAEYDRLVEALIAGRLTEARECELLRRAGEDPSLARLLAEQTEVKARIAADSAGLRERLAEGDLRSYVADLSTSAPVDAGVSGSAARGGSGIGRWIAGALLIGGTAVGIYFSGGNAAGPPESGATPEPAEAPTIESAPDGRHGSDPTVAPAHISGVSSATAHSAIDSTHARTPDTGRSVPREENSSIRMNAEVEGIESLP